MSNIFILIFIIFLIFILIQIYFYSQKIDKNNKIINKIESFENTLNNIDKNDYYTLDNSSLELLLKDYNDIKKNI